MTSPTTRTRCWLTRGPRQRCGDVARERRVRHDEVAIHLHARARGEARELCEQHRRDFLARHAQVLRAVESAARERAS